MKITAIHFHLCRQALEKPIPLSCGVLTHRNFGLIEIETNAGVTGWGETSINFPPWSAHERKATIEQGLAPMLIGQDPLQIGRLADQMRQGTFAFTRMWAEGALSQAISGIEMALWDIAGREYGVPVWQLLGGRHRDSVDLYATGLRTDDPAAGAKAAVAAGYRTIKMRVGFDDATDVRNAHLIRDAIGPDLNLMIDANQAFDLPRARRVIRQLMAVDPYWIEEPVPTDDVQAWRHIRAEFPRLSLAWGENSYALGDYQTMCGQQIVDVVMPDPCRSGGLGQAMKMAAYANDHGIPVSPHHYGSDLGFAACLHLVASTRKVSLMLRDIADVPLRDGIISEPFQISDGKVKVPEGVGLGVEIDRSMLERTQTRL